jgi:hypothetical protein
MQTKSSYRWIKWAVFTGLAASLATACVVSSGDGNGDGTDFGDGGDGNTGNKPSTSGGTTTAGTGGTSTTTGGTSAAGVAGAPEAAGGAPYVPGLCEVDMPIPSVVPSCAPAEGDDMNACKTCLKAQCCTEWKTCYGDEPHSACGFGVSKDDAGQFDCIQQCYLDTFDAGSADPDKNDTETVLGNCEGQCLNQCDGVDDFYATPTQDLLNCATDSCLADCLTPP